jgi:hypothetical protein
VVGRIHVQHAQRLNRTVGLVHRVGALGAAEALEVLGDGDDVVVAGDGPVATAAFGQPVALALGLPGHRVSVAQVGVGSHAVAQRADPELGVGQELAAGGLELLAHVSLLGLPSVDGGVHRSSTRRRDRQRETQIMIVVFSSCSSGVSTESRWSTST